MPEAGEGEGGSPEGAPDGVVVAQLHRAGYSDAEGHVFAPRAARAPAG